MTSTVRRPPGSRGLDSFLALFHRPEHKAYQRMAFLAQDAWLSSDVVPERLVVGVLDRQDPHFKPRRIDGKLVGRILRPNGMIPCLIYGREKRSYAIDWDDRLAYRYDWPIQEAWVPYRGPYAKRTDGDRIDWYKKALWWTPDREKKPADDWEAYEAMQHQKGITRRLA